MLDESLVDEMDSDVESIRCGFVCKWCIARSVVDLSVILTLQSGQVCFSFSQGSTQFL